MTALAMWFQDAATPTGPISAGAERYIVIFLGLIAASMVIQAVMYIGAGIVALKAMKAADGAIQEVKGAIAEVRHDLKTSTDEIKTKVYPVLEGVAHLGKTAQGILDEASPKLRTVSDHIVETSRVVRDSALKFETTAGDANTRAQRQVARVDHMVTATLDTTAEIAATIEHGIRVPAQKIASVAVQARHAAEDAFERLKSLAAGLPFLQGKGPAATARPRTYPAAAPQRSTGTTPSSATGPVPLVK